MIAANGIQSVTIAMLAWLELNRLSARRWPLAPMMPSGLIRTRKTLTMLQHNWQLQLKVNPMI